MKFQKLQTKKPSGGYATFLHILLTAALPALAYILVRLEFGWVAILLIFLSKWRMFAVKVRHWPANIRTNAVDIFVGLSVVVFMASTDVQATQVIWAGLYAGWLIAIKPQATPLWVGVQALIAQMVTLTAAFYFWAEASTAVLVVATWVITYFCARHFLTAFDEPMSRATAYAWAFFASSIAWLAGHWLYFFGPVAMPALLLSALAYGLAAMYYLEHTDKLTKSLRWQFISVMSVIVLFLILISDWSDKTI